MDRTVRPASDSACRRDVRRFTAPEPPFGLSGDKGRPVDRWQGASALRSRSRSKAGRIVTARTAVVAGTTDIAHDDSGHTGEVMRVRDELLADPTRPYGPLLSDVPGARVQRVDDGRDVRRTRSPLGQEVPTRPSARRRLGSGFSSALVTPPLRRGARGPTAARAPRPRSRARARARAPGSVLSSAAACLRAAFRSSFEVRFSRRARSRARFACVSCDFDWAKCLLPLSPRGGRFGTNPTSASHGSVIRRRPGSSRCVCRSLPVGADSPPVRGGSRPPRRGGGSRPGDTAAASSTRTAGDPAASAGGAAPFGALRGPRVDRRAARAAAHGLPR